MKNILPVFRLFAAGIILLGYLTITPQTAHSEPSEQEPLPLFSNDSSPFKTAYSRTTTLLRVREADINFSLLGRQDGRGLQLGRSISLNLFEDTKIIAVPTKVTSEVSGNLIWNGSVKGSPESTVTLVVHEEVAAGTIQHDGHLYKITYNGTDKHIIQEVQPHEPFPELPPIEVDLPTQLEQQAAPAQSNDDGSVVDIMILYTPAARQAQGGRQAIEALIDLAVEETNQAFFNSKIDSRLRLVQTAEVSYVESGSLSLDIGRLRIPGDGHMDGVPPARDNHGADLVSLIVERGNGCGIAYVMSRESASFEAYAFSVVQRQCVAGYYSLSHELAHNMGSEHNRDSQPPPGYGVSPYSYGLRRDEKSFRTIMAYNCSDGCTRIPYFSNPEVTYRGQATGISYDADPYRSADNAHSINNVLPTVANWRPSRESMKPPQAPANLKAQSLSPFSIHLAWDIVSNEARSIVIERSKDNQAWQEIAEIGGGDRYFLDQILEPESHYKYRIYAFNGAGESPYSNEVQASTGSAKRMFMPWFMLSGSK